MFPGMDNHPMPKAQMLLLGAFSGTFLAFATTDGTAISYVQNLLTSLPL